MVRQKIAEQSNSSPSPMHMYPSSVRFSGEHRTVSGALWEREGHGSVRVLARVLGGVRRKAADGGRQACQDAVELGCREDRHRRKRARRVREVDWDGNWRGRQARTKIRPQQKAKITFHAESRVITSNPQSWSLG